MKIESPQFQNNSLIPEKYTCEGDNINPPLNFKDIPNDTKSLVLICDDPDAPSGTWTHWTVWNISPDLNGIEENAVPKNSIQGKTSDNKTGYSGPCPPSGTHRYCFKLFALNSIIEISAESDVQYLSKAIENHIISQAELIGLYQRKN